MEKEQYGNYFKGSRQGGRENWKLFFLKDWMVEKTRSFTRFISLVIGKQEGSGEAIRLENLALACPFVCLKQF